MTFKGFISLIGIYFSEHFRSTFRVIKSGLISLGISIVLLLTSILVCYASFYETNFLGMRSLIEDIQKANLADYDVLMSIYSDHALLIHIYLICTVFVAATLFVILFIYLASKHSFTLTYRIKEPKYTGRMFLMITDNVLKDHRKEFLKAHFGTNYPMIIIFLGSFLSF